LFSRLTHNMIVIVQEVATGATAHMGD